MKLVISKSELVELLGKIQNVVAQKASIPILSNFMLAAENGELVLVSTDLTVGIKCYAQAKILEQGSVTLPAKKFFQLMREITSPNVEITASSGESVNVKAGTSEFKMNGMNTSEFPALPDLAGAQRFKIEQKVLKDMFFRTAFAVSREDNRYVLTGVLMQVAGGQVTFVGTDGKRLAKSHAQVNLEDEAEGDYILPLKAVEEIIKNISEEGEATIYLMNDKVAVETDSSLVITKLLSGDYPDYNRVIPQNPSISLSLHREELISLLKQVSLFTIDSSQSVRFTFTNGELRLRANSMEIGEGKVSMPVNYDGELFEIAFNPTFFLDILRHCTGETVMLGLTDPYNPGILRDTESEASLFVIMPMRLTEE